MRKENKYDFYRAEKEQGMGLAGEYKGGKDDIQIVGYQALSNEK